ncbi:MAG: wax ester/triacylglycerol synthase family O-acyltransferase, partial [Actinobacteria bacterium]|nr:wax ester/triacylglycerol synthase family O-acyltransferase [Actinomycetota bacterium]
MPSASRLSVLDDLFLHLETENVHMHIGAVALFGGPAPSLEEVADEMAHRLDRIPRFRQKLAAVPFGLGRPVWVDDPNFEIERHLRHAALPPPGDRRRLNRFVARTISEPLDLTGPPWELHLVEGLAGGCFALISKTHHCLVDGAAGVDAMMAFLDDLSAPARGPRIHWKPSPAPTFDELVADAVREQLTRARALAGELHSLSVAPHETADRTAAAIRRVGDFVASSFAAPSTTLNRTVGPQRSFETVPASFHDLRTVKNRFETTLNDVVLAVVAGGLRALLTEKGDELQELRALVPVSLRTSEDSAFGNRISSVWAPLPVDEPDPGKRL